MKNTNTDETADLIRDYIDGFLLKLNPDNLIDISQTLNIDIKGETNKRNVLWLIQTHVNGIEGEEHLIEIKKAFEKVFFTEVVADGNKDDAPTSRVSDKVTDDKTKGTLSSNNLYSHLGTACVDSERSAFHNLTQIERKTPIDSSRETNCCKIIYEW